MRSPFGPLHGPYRPACDRDPFDAFVIQMREVPWSEGLPGRQSSLPLIPIRLRIGRDLLRRCRLQFGRPGGRLCMIGCCPRWS